MSMPPPIPAQALSHSPHPPSPSPDAPLYSGHGVTVFRGRIQTATGTYDVRSVDGIEVVRATVPLATVATDVAVAVSIGAVAWLLFGANSGLGFFVGALVASRAGWWWAEQKYVAAVFLRGARVELATGNQATLRQLTSAVLAAAGGAAAR